MLRAFPIRSLSWAAKVACHMKRGDFLKPLMFDYSVNALGGLRLTGYRITLFINEDVTGQGSRIAGDSV